MDYKTIRGYTTGGLGITSRSGDWELSEEECVPPMGMEQFAHVKINPSGKSWREDVIVWKSPKENFFGFIEIVKNFLSSKREGGMGYWEIMVSCTGKVEREMNVAFRKYLREDGNFRNFVYKNKWYNRIFVQDWNEIWKCQKLVHAEKWGRY